MHRVSFSKSVYNNEIKTEKCVRKFTPPAAITIITFYTLSGVSWKQTNMLSKCPFYFSRIPALARYAVQDVQDDYAYCFHLYTHWVVLCNQNSNNFCTKPCALNPLFLQQHGSMCLCNIYLGVKHASLLSSLQQFFIFS